MTHQKTRLSRRSVLQAAGSALALAGAGLKQASAADAGSTTSDADVIVVGGGFAGVTAARECSKLGLKTLLLEARNRLGGRTFTREFAGHRVELGGTWIHWTQPFVWAETLRYGLEVEETPGASPERVVVLVDGKPHEVDAAQAIGGLAVAMDKYFEEARLVWERPYDASFRWQEILRRDAMTAADRMRTVDLPTFERTALTGIIETMSNAPLAQTSYVEMLRWYALPGWNIGGVFDSQARYKLKAGTAHLIDRIAKDGRAQIRLNTPVTQIAQDAAGVTVTTQSGERLRARTLILAVPMNVLKRLQFSPALSSDKIAASNEEHTGVGQKLYVSVRGNLGNSMLIAPGPQAIGSLWTYASSSTETLLVGFCPDVRAVDANDEESVERALRQVLPDASVSACTGYAWRSDPLALGTYANFRPGAFAKYYATTARDEGRIIMGLGDWGEGWRGFIDGAIGAGLRSAQRAGQLLLG